MPNAQRNCWLADGWRRHFHENPELMYETYRTEEIVAAKLRQFGCDEIVEAVGRSGVVASIQGKSNHKNQVIGLRADMDRSSDL